MNHTGIRRKNHAEQTLMTEGPIYSQIVWFALPLFLGNLFQQLYNAVDSLIVGNYVGSSALAARPSTAAFADVALRHHTYYANGGYPANIARIDSPYRQMTDVISVTDWLLDHPGCGTADIRKALPPEEKNRFSPVVLSCLEEPAHAACIDALRRNDDDAAYREIYDALIQNA